MRYCQWGACQKQMTGTVSYRGPRTGFRRETLCVCDDHAKLVLTEEISEAVGDKATFTQRLALGLPTDGRHSFSADPKVDEFGGDK